MTDHNQQTRDADTLESLLIDDPDLAVLIALVIADFTARNVPAPSSK